MAKPIAVYEGKWGEGNEYTWYIPDFQPLSTSTSNQSVRQYTNPPSNVAQYCDPDLTFFCATSQQVEYLVAGGVSHVFQIPVEKSGDYYDYYVSETTFIRWSYGATTTFGVGLSVSYYDANGSLNISSLFNENLVTIYTPTVVVDSVPYANVISLAMDTLTTAAAGKFRINRYAISVSNAGYDRYNAFWSGVESPDDDPYKQGGTSGSGGGTGTFSGTGDSIEFPNLPTLSAVSTGFITLFNPSIAQMQSLATYMWSDVFDIGLYKTLFADPMDCILGCSIVPVAVPNGGTKTVNVGNVSTGISMTVAASQYVEVDCGTLNVEEYWGSYLDYDPYTKAEIYLPYCGTHALQVDDIMGKSVHVKYHVDILSGACCAYVKCGGSVMYSFVGQCSSSIPISANDWTNVVNGALTIAASVGSLIATGGASAPMAVGAAAAVTGTIYGGGIKQNVEKSGSMGGTGGMLAVQTPYLILTRPRQALPKKQNTYTGYPSFITTKLEDLKGYTEIDSIRITGVPATDAELNELESILKSGVIF